jgi:large subunit ribosomal protein L29
MNSQITNPAKINETRKAIARLKTILKGKLNA